MLMGLGCDLTEVADFERELQRDPDFIHECFTPGEIAYCQGKRYSVRHFAARFAAKEAFYKALGTGRRDGMLWTDVAVGHGEFGRPHLDLNGITQATAKQLGVRSIHVSLSHTKLFATATVILEA
jgi:holo-[acyl-carrier protein] synthase